MFTSLIGYYQTLAEKTKSQATTDELGTWSEHFTIAMVLFGGICSLKSKSEGENSLIRWRTIDLLAHIPKIETSVRYGMYHSAIRELRFLFESMIQAFYLNEGHPDASITCKLELLKEIEKQLYGIRLIDRTTLREKQHLKDLMGTCQNMCIVHIRNWNLSSKLESSNGSPCLVFGKTSLINVEI